MQPLYYLEDSTNAGPLRATSSGHVQFRSIFSGRTKAAIRLFSIVLALINLSFILWLIDPSHLVITKSLATTIFSITCFSLIVIIELIRIIQATTISALTSQAVDPIPTIPISGKKVAMLTTVVPSKEPLEMVYRTLWAMRQVTYDGTVDVWILDEGDSDEVKKMAYQLGVKYFSRKGIDHYNQPTGTYRVQSKAGNHNAWRAEYEQYYDYVAQMDPDHIPFPNFLERTLGFFDDPDTGFVVAPQVYGNQRQNWLARASASQAYLFHGILQRAGNRFGSPLLIGTNHIYRTTAWHQIGGYQDSVIEDHLTSMTLNGTTNPLTNNRWRGVYTPDVVSVGEGPTSWKDYFSQQKRWSYGIWEIILHHSRRLDKQLSSGQSLYYAFLQFFYPSVAIAWVMGFIVSAAYFLFAIQPLRVNGLLWLWLWGGSFCLQLSFFLWLNRYNLNAHERNHGSMDALLLTLLTAPVYAAAAFNALCGRSLRYAVTAKGILSSADSYRTFKSQYYWTAASVLLLSVGIIEKHDHLTQIFWDMIVAVTGIIPCLIYTISNKLPNNYVYSASRHMIRVFKSRHSALARSLPHMPHISLSLIDPTQYVLKIINNL